MSTTFGAAARALHSHSRVGGVGAVLNSEHASVKPLPKHAAEPIHDEQPEECDCCGVPETGIVTRPCADSTSPTVRTPEERDRADTR